MIGWRLRLGLTIPSANAVIESEFNKMVPTGISVHASRMWLTADTEDQIKNLINYAEKTSQLLAHAGVDVIGFGCTTGSLIQGIGYDKEIIDIIQSVTGIQATTTTTAVISALQQLKTKKLTLVTPYPDWLTNKVIEFLEEQGYSILSFKSLGCEGPEIMDISPETVYNLVRQTVVPGIDGIFISCTGFRSIEVLSAIEADMGLPVISSNQALLWNMLRVKGFKTKITGFGTLLNDY